MFGLSIQSVRVRESNKSDLGNYKRLLRKSVNNRCDLFVNRDGHLIRYSSAQPFEFQIESAISKIKETSKDSLSLGDGSFIFIQKDEDGYIAIDVSMWVPRSIDRIPLSEIEKILQHGVMLISDSDISNGDIEKINILPELSDLSSAATIDRQKRAKQINIGACLTCAFLIASAGYYTFFYEEREQSIVLPTKTVSEVKDLFNDYREKQKGLLTVGKLLHVAESSYLIVRNSTLPNGWELESLTYNAGALKGRFISKGGNIAKIMDLKSRYDHTENYRFIEIDGQDTYINVPISADGGAMIDKVLPLEATRDKYLDLLAFEGAKRIVSTRINDHGGYHSVSIEAELQELPPTIIGRLSRAFANLPIYVSDFTLNQKPKGEAGDLNSELVSMKIKFTIYGITKEDSNEL